MPAKGHWDDIPYPDRVRMLARLIAAAEVDPDDIKAMLCDPTEVLWREDHLRVLDHGNRAMGED